MLLLLPFAGANAEWRRAETEHFVLYGDIPEADLRSRARNLERFDQLLRHFSSVTGDAEGPKFKVYIVGGDMAVSQRFQGSALGVYIPTMRGPFALVPNEDFGIRAFRTTPQQVLFHEYAHHFMLQYFPGNYPSWYIEGFADFYSTVDFPDDSQVEIGYPVQSHVPSLDGYDRWVSYEELLSSEHGLGWSSLAEGWLLVHYAAFNREARHLLEEYLAAMQRGSTGAEAYATSFGAADWNLHSAMRQYYRNDSVPVTTVPIAFRERAVEIETLSDTESDIALLYPRDGTSYGAGVRRMSNRYSENAQAQAEHAAYLIADQRYDEAIQVGERAVALDADNVDANLFLGTALIGAAARSGDATDERWSQGRTYLLRANHLDPYNPLALYRYYQSFPATQAPSDTEMATLEQAFRFVPQNLELRMALAVEFIAQERFDEARLLVMPAISSIHWGEREELAELLVERINERNSDVSDLRPVTRSVEFGA